MTSIWAIRQLGAGQQGGQGPEGCWLGQKSDPEVQRPRCPLGFQDTSRERAQAAASATGTLPDARVWGFTSDQQRYPNGRMAAPAGTGDRKCSLRAVAPAQQSKRFTKSTALSEQDRRNRVASFAPGCTEVQIQEPAACAPIYLEKVHTGWEARLWDGPWRPDAPSSAQNFHADSLFPLLKKASTLNYLYLARKHTSWERLFVRLNDVNLKALEK